MFKTVTEKPPFYLIPAGSYVVRCLKVEESNHEQYGPGVQWSIELPDPDDEEVVDALKDANQYPLRFTTPATFHKGSKTIQWAEAFAGRSFDEGEEWWLGVAGRSAQATITNRPPKNNPTGDIRHYIDALVPIRKKGKKKEEDTPAEDDF